MRFLGRSWRSVGFGAAWALAWVVGLAAPGLAAAQPQAPRANILFILVDDMDLALLKNMPRLKNLLTDRGVEFQNNLVSTPLCCPSRAATLRGQFAHNTGMFTSHWPDGGYLKFNRDGLENSTVATWLQGAGYRTALIGKYINGYPSTETGPSYIPPGWNHWFVPNGGTPYDSYRYRVNFNGRTLSYGSDPASHINDVLLGQANSFLRSAAADAPDKPFFLYLAPYLPHGPAIAPPRYLDRLPGIRAPRPPSFNEADMSDKPHWAQFVKPLTAADIADIDTFYRKRRQSIMAVDDFVASLVRTLQDTGELANTYIFFTSDNGFHQGQHRLKAGKGWPYEEDIRVPLIVRGPGIPAGRKVAQLSGNVDYAPTFAAIAGIQPPDFVDGRSLLPLFSGAAPARWRQVFLLEGPTSSEGSGAEMVTEASLLEPKDAQAAAAEAAPKVWKNHIYRGLRIQSNHTFTRYENGDGEFYDMNLDPFQLTNRYRTMPAGLKAALNAQLTTLRGAAGQALRNAEETLPAALR
ncbi:sulfatase family protein [Azohydromonas aeria]|uniref:sulfatase family protein n=1 Tax=Azohydromonas aeria TaxID=2590212 RepID=UPI0012FB7AE8|nr:sulfatase [Azohydromonas aeria]